MTRAAESMTTTCSSGPIASFCSSTLSGDPAGWVSTTRNKRLPSRRNGWMAISDALPPVVAGSTSGVTPLTCGSQ